MRSVLALKGPDNKAQGNALGIRWNFPSSVLAPQGPDIKAQGNALGPGTTCRLFFFALKGHDHFRAGAVAPFQGKENSKRGEDRPLPPGRCPGLGCPAPSGPRPEGVIPTPGSQGVALGFDVRPLRGQDQKG